ncbi:MAG: hypothetical protein IPP41_12015 [Rhodocyclaceae bacterium]|nr:hypothetical protein [Rhodocyclaceae bacterium]
MSIVAAIAYVRIDDHLYELTDAKVTARNFYGTLRVFNGGEGVAARRTLMHGQIVHGRQFATPALGGFADRVLQ